MFNLNFGHIGIVQAPVKWGIGRCLTVLATRHDALVTKLESVQN